MVAETRPVRPGRRTNERSLNGTEVHSRGKGRGESSALKDAEGEKAVLAAIAKMAAADRRIAERIHAIVRKAAPDLTPRTWYGMPAYSKDDKVICFFKDAGKFKERYSTFGFNEQGEPRRRFDVADRRTRCRS